MQYICHFTLELSSYVMIVMFLLFFHFIIVRVVEVMTYMYTAHVGKFITRERFMPVSKTGEALGKQLCSIVSAAHAITVL